MERYKIIEVRESVFANNDREAERVRRQLKAEKTFLLNLMSSPGSGKTTTLLRTIETLKGHLNIGVMEADIDSDVDAEKIAAAGVKSIAMLPQKKLLPLTGYVHGGCSPVGMSKPFPTFFAEEVILVDTMVCSAGKVGHQVEVRPDDLIAFVGGQVADLTAER